MKFLILFLALYNCAIVEKFLPSDLTASQKSQFFTELDKLERRFPLVKNYQTNIKDTDIYKFLYFDFTFSSAGDLTAGFAF